jgi:hypothetical protein
LCFLLFSLAHTRTLSFLQTSASLLQTLTDLAAPLAALRAQISAAAATGDATVSAVLAFAAGSPDASDTEGQLLELAPVRVVVDRPPPSDTSARAVATDADADDADYAAFEASLNQTVGALGGEPMMP